MQQEIIKGLNEMQTSAVTSTSGETLVIAGAGSGKTAVLTRRCAYLIAMGAVPGSILSLTFTNKAAAEMRGRMGKLLISMGINLPPTPPWSNDYVSNPLFCTFHSLGVRLLREFGEKIDIKNTFNILDPDDLTKMLRGIIKELNIDTKTLTPNFASHFISACKQELLTPEFSSKLEKEYLPAFHTIYKKYWEACRQNNVIDFDDLIFLPYLIIRDHQDAREICQRRWKHIQIDEFQDTNTAQFELIYLIYPNLKRA